MAITLVDDKNDIVGHASFLDYPNRQYSQPNEWESWFKVNYDLDKCTVRLVSSLSVINCENAKCKHFITMLIQLLL